MSLGGGTFTVENKAMPGAYISFISTERGNFSLSERGVGAIGLDLNWGPNNLVETDITTIRQNCQRLLGYSYNSSQMRYVRDFYKHGKKLIVGRINKGKTYAECSYARAKYMGSRGNDISIAVSVNVDNSTKYDFITYIDGVEIDNQTASSTSALKGNDYVIWKTVSSITTGIYRLSGGTEDHSTGAGVTDFCSQLERYSFNALTIISDDDEAQRVMIEFTRRMRDERGFKFQYITYNQNADYEGVISVYNPALDGDYECGLAAWVCGAAAGCQVNQSLTNMKYDGDTGINHILLQSDIERLLGLGHFIFHKVNSDERVLMDINTLKSYTEEKGEVFQNNQTVRVCDQIATDTAALFTNYYIGKVPNDKAGRHSLWSELVKYHKQLMDIRAIEDFDEDDIEVDIGESKTSVVVNESITPVNSMEKLYMKVYIE